LAQTAVTLDQNVVVEPTSATNLGKIAIAKARLSLGDISAVISNLVLPSAQDDATVTWSSNNTAVIANNGIVTSQAVDTVVTLTATIRVGTEVSEKLFAVTVKGIVQT
jgi:hypothetical protein